MVLMVRNASTADRVRNNAAAICPIGAINRFESIIDAMMAPIDIRPSAKKYVPPIMMAMSESWLESAVRFVATDW